jgi:hypothetical protein
MRPQCSVVRPDGATRAFPIPRDPLATLAILLITSILKKGAGSDNLARSSELVQHVLECGSERCGCSGCGAAKRALAQCVGCGCEVGGCWHMPAGPRCLPRCCALCASRPLHSTALTDHQFVTRLICLSLPLSQARSCQFCAAITQAFDNGPQPQQCRPSSIVLFNEVGGQRAGRRHAVELRLNAGIRAAVSLRGRAAACTAHRTAHRQPPQ